MGRIYIFYILGWNGTIGTVQRRKQQGGSASVKRNAFDIHLHRRASLKRHKSTNYVYDHLCVFVCLKLLKLMVHLHTSKRMKWLSVFRCARVCAQACVCARCVRSHARPSKAA